MKSYNEDSTNGVGEDYRRVQHCNGITHQEVKSRGSGGEDEDSVVMLTLAIRRGQYRVTHWSH